VRVCAGVCVLRAGEAGLCALSTLVCVRESQKMRACVRRGECVRESEKMRVCKAGDSIYCINSVLFFGFLFVCVRVCATRRRG